MTKTLNAGQQAAAEGFFEFLLGNGSELIISGPGGVGKTFLMGHLIDEVMPRYHEICRMMGIPTIYRDVVMTATTNKAAEVLGKATGRPTQTVHSFFNLVVKDDFATGRSSLTRSKSWKVHQQTIIFVDEASMIDSALLAQIKAGTYQCKVVYVGDHCQLAPVMEPISPIYVQGLPFFELTEPMRNADQPALMEACSQLRQTVETKEFWPIKIVPGVIDYLEGPEMEKEVATHFLRPDNQDRILAYTNNQVMAYNDHIRGLRALPPRLTVGEIVVNNSVIVLRTGMMRVEDEYEITAMTGNTTMVEIEPGTELEVVHATLVGRHETFTNVPVPVDRAHFNALVKYYANQKNWRLYYELKNNYPDLRPRDAATVHKAQGSTYDTVFIDLSDLSTCRNPAAAARLLYVAFSRAKRRVVMYGRLAAKYGGVA